MKTSEWRFVIHLVSVLGSREVSFIRLISYEDQWVPDPGLKSSKCRNEVEDTD